MQITRGRIPGAKKVLIYGPEGIGKSTFASQFPNPVFIDTEGSTKELDVARFPAPSSWTMLKEDVRYVIQHPEEFKTLVIDTADWAEKLAIQAVLDEHNKHGIEDFGYGNGYRYVYERFGELLNLLSDVVEKGVNVVLTAHATLRKFEQPDEMGAYDRYTMKLIDTPKTSIGAAVKEWADMVLFANYKTLVVTDSKTKKTKAQGGKRIMYTTHHTCWDAKNRYGLPEEMPFEYASIRSIIEAAAEPAADTAKPVVVKAAEEEPMPAKSEEKPAKEKAQKTAAPAAVKRPEPEDTSDLDMRIPKALRDLMEHDRIGEWDIENFAESKGFVPFGTKIWEYETVNPGIIEGLFVAQWPKVRDRIREARKNEAIPFTA